MSCFKVFVLTLLSVIVFSSAHHIIIATNCPSHSQFNDCGTVCPKTCKNKDILVRCVDKCMPGCFCEPGYVLNDNKECVPVEECPKTCPPNSQYNACGTACPRTCSNKDEHSSCTEQCVPGCYCEPGYVLDEQGTCVPEQSCHKQCPAHSQYNACGTACPRTCSNKDEHSLCTEQCVPGCYCEPGYVLDEQGACVPEQSCHKKCPTHSQYNACGTACPRTCNNKDDHSSCTEQCVPGCYCEPGYVLDKQGTCVPEQSCSKSCPPNFQYNACGTACPRTCSNKDQQLSCTDQCVPGCYCEPGYVLDKQGTCVPEQSCSKSCPPNSQYNACGTACPRTCSNKDEQLSCTDQCVPGCYCEPGYVLNEFGVCVPEKSCPKKCPPHAQYNECGAACTKTCKNKDKDIVCKEGCKPGCFCEPGYVLDNEECIPEDTCRPTILYPVDLRSDKL